MAIPPLFAIGAAASAGAAAGSAVRSVGHGFADMLKKAVGAGADKTAGIENAAPASSTAANPDAERASLTEEVSRFARQIAALLARRGIEPGVGLQLGLDALGKVRVVGNHPEKSRIEALFAADGELVDRFQQLADRAEALSAGEPGADGFAPLACERFTLRVGGSSAGMVAAGTPTF